ncbi:MAG TPA: adenylyltransferase/cytidyltransferase family protein, partial [Cyclobacteriaceae bacterium]|nr:adenylyltransferase/cytidyltransferase family protein [Cyclobacteriaceae bacterium]
MKKRIALFPGSFDPFTKGHEDIVLRGLQLFDEIVIAIGYNSQKSQRYFEINLMMGKIRETFKNYPNIRVEHFSLLTAEFAR